MKTDIKSELMKFKEEERLFFKLIQVQKQGVVWELNNPYGFNLFIVCLFLGKNLTRVSRVNVPSMEKIKLGLPSYKSDVTVVGSKSIERIVDGTCITFDDLKDALVLANKVCGDIIENKNVYQTSNKLYSSLNTLALDKV